MEMINSNETKEERILREMYGEFEAQNNEQDFLDYWLEKIKGLS